MESDHEWPIAVVNLHRRRLKLPEIVHNEDLDVYQIERELTDNVSKTALLEQERVRINEVEINERSS